MRISFITPLLITLLMAAGTSSNAEKYDRQQNSGRNQGTTNGPLIPFQLKKGDTSTPGTLESDAKGALYRFQEKWVAISKWVI